jgi:outer membrane lipoprotein-sorting protein
MRWLMAIGIIVLAPPAQSQQNDAEKLFRAVEKKVREAKSLNVVYKLESNEGTILTGRIQLAEDNKARIEMEGRLGAGELGGGWAMTTLLVSNGKNLVERTSNALSGQQNGKELTPKEYNKRLASALVRLGPTNAVIFASPQATLFLRKYVAKSDDIERTQSVTDFKMGEKERVGYVEAQVISFQCTDWYGITCKAKLWIDPEAMVPLKRENSNYYGSANFKVDKGKGLIVETEVYTEFTVDPKFDDKLFELPKR